VNVLTSTGHAGENAESVRLTPTETMYRLLAIANYNTAMSSQRSRLRCAPAGCTSVAYHVLPYWGGTNRCP
jgi:hypothetical protein